MSAIHRRPPRHRPGRRPWLWPLLASAVVLIVGVTGATGAGAAAASTAAAAERTASPTRDGYRLPPELERLLRELGDQGRLDERGAQIPPAPHHLPRVPHGYKTPPGGRVFDIDLFIRNIRMALDDEAVGYTFSIGKAGQLYKQDGVGNARTAADSPETDQSPTKPMTVASISKTVTAVLVLRLLEHLDISVDDPIGPWLPDAWERGDGVDDISFRDLMTHTSGLRQSYEAATGKGGKVTGKYDNIRIAVAQDLGNTGYVYANMNFSIFRLIVPKLLGHDFSVLYDNPPGPYTSELFNLLYGAIFQQYLHQTLATIGVPAACQSWDPDPTILYKHPDDGNPGWEVQSYLLGCGGYGFQLSANGLTAFLSYLRYTDQLLSPASRALMYDGLLGLKSYQGAQGDYLGHGGAWKKNGRGMYGCVMSFHIHVDASLLISSRGATETHPCTILRTAFDSAWVG